MSVPAQDQRAGDWPPAALAGRLGFLLKHAQIRFAGEVEAALSALDVDGREFAVLGVLADEEPLSQQQAAQRLAIDRTTMVALLDRLEAKGLVERRPAPGDRRRNIVTVTVAGRRALERTASAVERAESDFLAPLGEDAARDFRAALQAIVAAAPPD